MRGRVAGTLLVAYAVFVAVVVMWPSPVDRDQAPLIAHILRTLHDWGAPRWFDYGALEFTANIVMFVPLCLLLGLVLPTRLGWVPFLVGPLASIVIELGQYLFLSDRFGSVRDVASNSVGAVIGALLALAVHRRLDRRSRAA